jgi:ribosomal protein L24E
LTKNPRKINWGELSRNPNAIRLLEQHPNKINWLNLSQNPNAIHLLEQNPNKIAWGCFSANPNAIHLLKQNPDKIHLHCLTINPNGIHILCKLDYQRMVLNNQEFTKELSENVFNPSRIERLAKIQDIDMCDYLEYY